MPEHYQMSLPLLTLEQAQAEGRVVLEKAHKQVGFIPNMYAAMAHVPGLLETYLTGYDTLRKDASLTSQEQETIFLTISRENGCEYCMAAHSTLADTASKLAPEVTEAIRNNPQSPIPNPRFPAGCAVCFHPDPVHESGAAQRRAGPGVSGRGLQRAPYAADRAGAGRQDPQQLQQPPVSHPGG